MCFYDLRDFLNFVSHVLPYVFIVVGPKTNVSKLQGHSALGPRMDPFRTHVFDVSEFCTQMCVCFRKETIHMCLFS